jgi:hypothetical protein
MLIKNKPFPQAAAKCIIYWQMIAEWKICMFAVDALSAQYFTAKATAEHKTTMEIIGELVREKIAASSG